MREKKKNPLRFLIWLVILGGLVFFGFQWFINSLKSPVNPKAETQAFVVQKGESVASIADRLEKEKIIKSALFFRYLYQTSHQATPIQAGDFKISAAMSTEEIIENFTQGAVDKWLTLLEGWRVEEMARKINQDLGISEKDFLEYAEEGYMFPDSYLFNKDASAQTIASTLKNTFDQRYTEDIQVKMKTKGLTPDQGVILASIVEREARSDEVRTKVASILLKRFKMGMKLDADATVQYAKDTQSLKSGKLEKFWQPITRANYTDVISPYNTYLNNGLPPAPICNPSLSSLKAVSNADPNTPYLFYYHDSQGNSYYARTLDEHNANVANHR